MVTLFIPNTFQPEGDFADELAILADALLIETFRFRNNDNRLKGYYIPFAKPKWLMLFHSSKYPAVKQAAVAAGLIDLNESFSQTRFPKSLRLKAKHRHGNFATYTLKQKRRRSFRKRNIHSKSLGEVGRWLVEHFKSVRFDGQTWDEPCLSVPSNRLALKRIQAGGWYASRCEFGRRFHSNYSNLKSELRKHIFLNIEGGSNRAASIDVTACQPLILGISAHLSTVNNVSNVTTEQDVHNGLKTTCVSKDSMKPDVRRWIELCEQGVIYEFFQERFQAGDAQPRRVFTSKGYCFESDPSTFDRNATKKTLLVALFDTFAGTFQNAAFDVMLGSFPNIAAHIVCEKQADHRSVAKACQRIESGIMIDGVCSELMQSHPSLPLIAIHDELICSEQQAPSVTDAVRRQFQRLGVDVSVKSKLLGLTADHGASLPTADCRH